MQWSSFRCWHCHDDPSYPSTAQKRNCPLLKLFQSARSNQKKVGVTVSQNVEVSQNQKLYIDTDNSALLHNHDRDSQWGTATATATHEREVSPQINSNFTLTPGVLTSTTLWLDVTKIKASSHWISVFGYVLLLANLKTYWPIKDRSEINQYLRR